MLLSEIENLLRRVNGCTFASMDSVTKPSPGIRKEVTGERVILFSNKLGSGYEKMVRRRLAKLGRDPESFILHDLPWGERIPGTPIIQHRGCYYLQTVMLHPGEVRVFIGNREVRIEDLPWLKAHPNDHQGLPTDKQVYVHTYGLETITAIRMLGEEVTALRT